MSINVVVLAGNLTRDPELKITPSGTSVLEDCPGHEQRPGRAQLCPVCKGSGNLWTVGPDAVSGNVGNVSRRCHGCDGKGWVAVFEAPGEDDK